MGWVVGDERAPGPTGTHTNVKQLLNPRRVEIGRSGSAAAKELRKQLAKGNSWAINVDFQ